ncbi:MAG: TonB-dependent receptor plug domain-containing protein [Fibrobacter sp.]|nr:TonB-dependent receptor plug domain-containing protein [Fibrobacter sp.]
MKRLLTSLFMLLLLPVWTAAQNATSDSLAQAGPKGILFNGVVQDTAFAAGEKLYVEILESGEAVETVVGSPFSVVLPDDTLWNVCVTNSDTAGAAKEKCYELVYTGSDSTFSHVLGDAGLTDSSAVDSAGSEGEIPGQARDDKQVARNDSSGTAAEPASVASNSSSSRNDDDVDVDALLAAGNNGKVTEMKKVVVQLRRRPKRTAGESVVSTKSIKRMPGLGEADVIRSIQQLPGVVASSDFSTKIYVRGGAADQNLFLYDNAVVYSPTHFFGLFSTFLVETIDDVQFYKSGFPAQYGNRLSSVLKMDGRAGGQDTVEEWFSKSSIKVSTFATQLHTEGHKGNARWVIAGRTTYIGYMLDLCRTLGILDLSIDYEFTDLQGGFVYDFSKDTRLKIGFYVGHDELSFDPLYVDWGNIAVPINFFHRINDNWDYNATLAFSRFYQTMELTDLINLGQDLYTWSAKQWLNFRGIPGHTITAGYELEYDWDKFYEYISTIKVSDYQKPFHHVLYGQDAWRLNDDWLLTYGLRLNYQTLSNDFGFEPRFSLVWNIDEKKTLEFYGGHYLQYMNSIMFSDGESLNEFYYPSVTTSKGTHLKPASSNLFAVEYKQAQIKDQYDFIAGAYFKTQNNLNTYVMSQDSTAETSAADFLLADYFGTAEGYSLGYELSLRREKGAVFGGVNWSQSLSVLKSNDGSKAYFPSWHQPYALKADMGINWKGEDGIWQYKKKKDKDFYFRSSVVLKYSAGMPISEYLGYFYESNFVEKKYAESVTVVPGSRNAGRQTPYFRIDVKAIDVGREDKWNFSWTIINLTDHENMFYSYYDTSKNPPEYKTMSQFPFLPIMLNYEYRF